MPAGDFQRSHPESETGDQTPGGHYQKLRGHINAVINQYAGSKPNRRWGGFIKYRSVLMADKTTGSIMAASQTQRGSPATLRVTTSSSGLATGSGPNQLASISETQN